MRVGIEGALFRQPCRRPVLPPVEVPLEPLIQLAGVAVEVSRPRAPRLLVGALQIAEVVDLESGRAALEVALEQEVVAAHLAELQRLEIAPERRARRIEAPRVGAL